MKSYRRGLPQIFSDETYTSRNFQQSNLSISTINYNNNNNNIMIIIIIIIIIIVIIIIIMSPLQDKGLPNLLHSSLSDACLFQVNQGKLLISSSHLVLCLPCLLFTIHGLPLRYSNIPSIISSSRRALRMYTFIL